MKKVRTQSQLTDAMSEDFAWRKRELLNLKSLVEKNRGSHIRDMCVRAALTLLYAHWEGFIKRIGSLYLEYVARQQLKHSELASPFLASAVSGLVRGVLNESGIRSCMEVVKFFRSDAEEKSSINFKSGINTKANLKSDVFHEIVVTLGLDYTRFQTKEQLIDERLLKNRNHIAHGKTSLVDVDDYLSLHDEVQSMMQDFYNQVENAASVNAFRNVAN